MITLNGIFPYYSFLELSLGMATQSEHPPRQGRSAEGIAISFIGQYYTLLHHSPERVYLFYQDTSISSRQDLNGLMRTVTTRNVSPAFFHFHYFRVCAVYFMKVFSTARWPAV